MPVISFHIAQCYAFYQKSEQISINTKFTFDEVLLIRKFELSFSNIQFWQQYPHENAIKNLANQTLKLWEKIHHEVF